MAYIFVMIRKLMGQLPEVMFISTATNSLKL